MNPVTQLLPGQILELIPQRPPFRFVDQISEVTEERISGSYLFRGSESFYDGHFPGSPITPGVLLLECMAQFGVVAFGLYLLSLELPRDDLKKWITLFTDAQVEFTRTVPPDTKVSVLGERIYWRGKKLRSAVEMRLEGSDELVAQGIVAGIGRLRQ